MYEKDGEKYFVVDGHVHYWDASPGNWIECFYGYHQLGPEEYYRPMEKYQKYSEETMMKDLFEDGYVDKAIFLPTYLKSWYKECFNTYRAGRHSGTEVPGQVHPQRPLRAAGRRGGT